MHRNFLLSIIPGFNGQNVQLFDFVISDWNASDRYAASVNIDRPTGPLCIA